MMSKESHPSYLERWGGRFLSDFREFLAKLLWFCFNFKWIGQKNMKISWYCYQLNISIIKNLIRRSLEICMGVWSLKFKNRKSDGQDSFLTSKKDIRIVLLGYFYRIYKPVDYTTFFWKSVLFRSLTIPQTFSRT